MEKSKLPVGPEATPRSGMQFDLSPKALEQWNTSVHAAADGEENTISIYEVIGFDFWTGGGVTAKRIDAALRSIGRDKDVVVNINSPGGDVFEGIAIYNLFREHKGKVTMKIVGLAASAASMIAMAGDEILIARSAFYMIHNAWTCICGDRTFMREIADWLEPFDMAIADIYAVRTGIDENAIVEQMDAETWIGGKEAVDKGWADDFLGSDTVKEDKPDAASQHLISLRIADVALAKMGIPRSERKKHINQIKTGTHDAAGGGTPGATAADMPGAVKFNVEPLPKLNFNSGT